MLKTKTQPRGASTIAGYVVISTSESGCTIVVGPFGSKDEAEAAAAYRNARCKSARNAVHTLFYPARTASGDLH